MFKNKYAVILLSLLTLSLAGSVNGQTPVIPPVPTVSVSANDVTLSAIVDDVVVKSLDIPAGTLVEFKTTKPVGTKGNWLVYSTEEKKEKGKATGFKASVLDSAEDVARYIRPAGTPKHKLFVTYQVVSTDGKKILSALTEINYGVDGSTPDKPKPKPTPTPTPDPVTPTPAPSPVPVILTPSASDITLTQDIPRFMVGTNKEQVKDDAVALAVMYNEFATFIADKTDIYTSTATIQSGNKLVGQSMFNGALKGKYTDLGAAIDKALENKLTLKIVDLTPEKRADAVNIIRAIAWQFAEVAKK